MTMSAFFVLTKTLFLLLGTLPIIQGANVTDVRFGNRQANGRSGVLEIEVNGDTWGVVCDDGWNSNPANAIVACRALGFTNGGTAELSGKYGAGTGGFLLDDADCSTDMTSLAQCESAQTNDCVAPGDKSVGLDCNQVTGPGVTTFQPPVTTKVPSGVISDNCQKTSALTVRLFGKVGIPGMGLVEVQNPSTRTWGYVCDDGWNAEAAKVVCAQLCFPTNYTAKPGIPAEHKVTPQNPVIILDNVKCAGTESTLQQCPSNNFATTNNCDASRGEFAGVQCVEADFQPPSPPDPRLKCGGGFLQADFYRSRDSNLEEKHLSVLNDPTCADVSKSTSPQFVSIIIPVDKCGTTVARNGSHILYNNEIKYASTLEEGPITRFNTYRVAIECAMPTGKVVTQRVQAVTQSVTENSVGVIAAGMKIYRSDSFNSPVTENPVRIPLGEFLNLAITMENNDPRLKLVVTDCVSTPTGDTTNTRLTKVLFKDKCPLEKTLSTYPISNFEYGVRFKPFKFVNYPLLYIQCDSIICLAEDVTNECDRSCNNTKPAAPSTGRKKRSAVVQQKSYTSPAVFLYDPHAPDPLVDKTKEDDKIKVVIANNNNKEKTASPQQEITKLQELAIETSTVSVVAVENEIPQPPTADPGKGKEAVEGHQDNGVANEEKAASGGILSLNDGNSAGRPVLSVTLFILAIFAFCTVG